MNYFWIHCTLISECWNAASIHFRVLERIKNEFQSARNEFESAKNEFQGAKDWFQSARTEFQGAKTWKSKNPVCSIRFTG